MIFTSNLRGERDFSKTSEDEDMVFGMIFFRTLSTVSIC